MEWGGMGWGKGGISKVFFFFKKKKRKEKKKRKQHRNNTSQLTLTIRTVMSPTPEPYLDVAMNCSTSAAKLEQKTNASFTPEASRNSSTYASMGVSHKGNNTFGVSSEMGRHVEVNESARMSAWRGGSLTSSERDIGLRFIIDKDY